MDDRSASRGARVSTGTSKPRGVSAAHRTSTELLDERQEIGHGLNGHA